MTRTIDKKMEVSYSSRRAIVIASLALVLNASALVDADVLPADPQIEVSVEDAVEPVLLPPDDMLPAEPGTSLDDLAAESSYVDPQILQITTSPTTNAAPVLIPAHPAVLSGGFTLLLLLPLLRRRLRRILV